METTGERLCNEEDKSAGDTGAPEVDPIDPINDVPEEDEWMDILGSGQLKKKITKRGQDGVRPQRSDICLVNIEGTVADGTVVETYENFHFQIGEGEVVQGLDLALPLMCIGEEALIEVGSRFAYGSLGREPHIEPNVTLFYKVALVSAYPEPEIESFSAMDRKKIGTRKRERGNWWYARDEPIHAIQCYRRALEYLDDIEGGIVLRADGEDETPMSDELRDLFDNRLKVYNNLAAAQMKINAFDAALQSVQNVLNCQPTNVKALFRKGKILEAKGEFAEAVAVLRAASQLEPESKLFRQEINRLLSLQKADTKQETNLYKKMLGQGKGKATSSSPKKSSLYPWAAAVAGFAAIVVSGVIAYRYKLY